MNICVNEIKTIILELVFPKRYFLNPSLTKSLTYVLSFPSTGCQMLKPSKEWKSGVEAK